MSSLKYINKYFYKYRWRLILGVIFVAISTYYAVDSIPYARKAVDFISENSGKLPNDVIMMQVVKYVLIIFGLAILSGLFLFLTRQTIIVMSRLIEYDMKNEIYDKYQQLDTAFYKRNNTGDLMNRISEDVGRVRMYTGPAIMYIFNTFLKFLFTIIAMIIISPSLTFYSLIPLPLLAISIYYVSHTINKKGTKVQEKLSDITTYTQEAFSGIRILKAYGRETQSVRKFEVLSDEYKQTSMSLVKTESLFQPFILLLIGVSNLSIIYLGGKMVIDKVDGFTYGNILEFLLLLNALTWPIASLGWVTSLIQRAAASQTRINEFLHTEPEVKTKTTLPITIQGQIAFQNVSFTYPDSGIVALKNVSFNVKQGQSLAIIGRTGSGKSTIANLLCRMYDCTSGAILIDDQKIDTIRLESLRDQIGYVPQEVFLFSDTISGNIGFSVNKEKQDISAIETAAKNAVIYSNIIAFPDKFETIVGERGITLSGGQKQRISIARAIIKEPKILIFDDCLSAVDTETEEEILTNLKQLMKGKTSIIISHRVSSVKQADIIIVLDNGTVVESGNHKELLEKQGAYHNLYKMQLLEAEENIQKS